MTTEVICSHQDESRSKVGLTAFAVAYMRGLEGKRQNPLFVDPYAEALGGDMRNDIEKYRVQVADRSESQRARMADMCGVRTKTIDDFVVQNLRDGSTEQILVFGAGLDTRAWRLKLDPPQQKSISYFELDFPEIFNYKLPKLEQMNAMTDFNYHAVSADLSLPNWTEIVEKAGFDRKKKTLFLMEGFANYLKEEELTPLMTTVAALGPQGGCKLISTYISASHQREHSLNLHRFWPENPLEFVKQFGWVGTQEDVEDLATFFGRKTPEGEERRGYYIIKASK